VADEKGSFAFRQGAEACEEVIFGLRIESSECAVWLIIFIVSY
jgi:hypothetical protein